MVSLFEDEKKPLSSCGGRRLERTSSVDRMSTSARDNRRSSVSSCGSHNGSGRTIAKSCHVLCCESGDLMLLLGI